MTQSIHIPVKMTGQSGCRLSFANVTVYFDPYLSNSVQELESADMGRQVSIPFLPEKIADADWVLISHDHLDHCDPHTLPKLAKASPQARFIGPYPVIEKLIEWNLNPDQLILATEAWMEFAPGLKICAIPAAHPEIARDLKNRLSCVGYLIDFLSHRIYLAGDTSARQEIIEVLIAKGPIHTAFLPVNEHNFFKENRGIVGNMSIHEAFRFAAEIGVKQMVAVHWDMFAMNHVDPEEIRFIHKRMGLGFTLLLNPGIINLSDVHVSIIIRTFNEAAHIEQLLTAINTQQTEGLSYEVILVDSGSTDETQEIAVRHGCRLYHIAREEFSFGRSLNIGCDAARGGILVIISGHCIPVGSDWLQRLCQPLLDGKAGYVYGRQIGSPYSYYSECRLFEKHYPGQSRIPQNDFFVNNANAALARGVFETYRFDEELSGLEDMKLAKQLTADGGRVGYAAEACVIHCHNETWPQVRRRFEREAIAMRRIMPQLHVSLYDTLRFFVKGVRQDTIHAWRNKLWIDKVIEIIRYRWNQYLGAYRGNQDHRKLSQEEKERYYFPQ